MISLQNWGEVAEAATDDEQVEKLAASAVPMTTPPHLELTKPATQDERLAASAVPITTEPSQTGGAVGTGGKPVGPGQISWVPVVTQGM